MQQQQPELANGLPQHISVTSQQLQLLALVQLQPHQLLQLDVPLESSPQLGLVAVPVTAIIL
jgi:hypothetical protein